MSFYCGILETLLKGLNCGHFSQMAASKWLSRPAVWLHHRDLGVKKM